MSGRPSSLSELSELSDRVRCALFDGGVKHVLSKIGHKVIRPIADYGQITIQVRELSAQLHEAPLPAGFSIHICSPEVIPLLLAGHSDSTSSVVFEERFRKGDRCIAVTTSSGRVIHSRWFSTIGGAIPELGMEIILASGQAYLYDSYTLPEMRGRGIDRAASHFTFQMLRDCGVRTSFAYVRGDDPRRLKAVKEWERQGGKLHYLTFRGCRPLVFGLRALGGTPNLVRKRWNVLAAWDACES